MNWDEFEKEIGALVERVDYTPDMIVPITRGGLVPGRLLATRLQVKPMHCVSVEKQGGERAVVTEITEDLVGKNILLVEDMLESGKSLAVAQQYLEKRGANVRTACLYTMPISEVTPDYSLREVGDVVAFPWE